MEQSPSAEVNISSASQEISPILWNPKVRYRIHKRQPPVPSQRQINPVHAFPSHFLNSRFNIMLSSRPRSSKWLFPSDLATRILHALPLYPTRSTCLAYLIHFDLITRKIFGEQYKSQNSLLRSLAPPLLSHPSWVKIFSFAPYPRTPSNCSSRNVRDQVSHPYKTTYISALLIR